MIFAKKTIFADDSHRSIPAYSAPCYSYGETFQKREISNMDVENLPKTTANDEEELIEEKPAFCTNEDPDFPVEDFEDIETKDQAHQIAQEYSFSEDYYAEEEWLLEEKTQNNLQDATEDNQREAGTLDIKKEVKLKNITFEDKEMPKADMLVCKLCHRVFMDENKLRSHMFKIHRVKKLGRPRKVNRLNSLQKEFPKENWTPDVQKLAKRADSGKVFVCDQCPYTVTRCDSMTKHVLRVHSKGLVKPQYMCEVCGKTFVDRAYLRNHGLSHVQEPQFFCEICGRRFHRQPSLKRHIQSHSEEKQFSCSLCDYQTNRKHLMYKHAENHRTGKAYSCKYCPDKFFTQMSLRKHCYTHHPTRYACSFCKIGFSSRERMWSHMQKIHFACEVRDLITETSAKQDEIKVEYIEVKF